MPTPNLPVVDKLVGGVQALTKSYLPKCPANSVTDLTLIRSGSYCRPCGPGQVAPEGAKECASCGMGRCGARARGQGAGGARSRARASLCLASAPARARRSLSLRSPPAPSKGMPT